MGFSSSSKLVNQNKGYAHVVSWNEDGTGFYIISLKEFEKLLCEFFATSRFQSFVSRLKMCGFEIDETGERRVYFHPLFRREGIQELLEGLQEEERHEQLKSYLRVPSDKEVKE